MTDINNTTNNINTDNSINIDNIDIDITDDDIDIDNIEENDYIIEDNNYNNKEYLFSTDEWQILEKNIEIDDKINLQLYIYSDLNKKIYNINYLMNILQKSLKNNFINMLTDNEIIKILINPSLYLSLASKLSNISVGIINKFLTIHTTYTLLLDKTITDNIVNYYYSKAFEIAYLQLINECINKCMPLIIKINTLNYKFNQTFLEIITLSIEIDMLLITINNITYVFSKYYFLNNNIFQEKINNIISKMITNITITFFNNISKNEFNIILERK